ncbi:MAG: alcohol dehydrogenase [Hyphomicrobiales bacterium]
MLKRQSIIEYGAPLAATEAELPQPRGREVLLRVGHCGVCHSDLHLQDGHFDLGGGRQLDVTGGRALPFTLGHEIEGTVAAIGDAVEGVAVGERHVVYPWIGCGTCPTCAAGDEHLCDRPRALGITVDGGYASHVLVPDPRYLIDFGDADPGLAGTYMCSGLTAFSAVRKLGDLARRGPALIVGLGGVGMMGVQFARALTGVAPYVADIDPAKREAAMALGAAGAFDPAAIDARKAFLKATGGVYGAIDFAGTSGSVDFATGGLKKGGKAVIVGLIGGTFQMPVAMFPLRAIAIEGSYVGSLAEAREMMEIVRAGRVAPIPLAARPLEDANEVLDALRGGRIVGRVVLEP